MIREKLNRFGFHLKTHATVFLIGIAFAMAAYGLIHLLMYAIRYGMKFFL